MWKKILLGVLVLGILSAFAVGIIALADNINGNAGRQGRGEVGGGYRGGRGILSQSRNEAEVPALGRNAIERAPIGVTEKVRGLVTSVESGDIIILTDEGKEVAVGIGPAWFWEEKGVALQVGDEVEVIGAWNGDEFRASMVTIWTKDGQATTIHLRSDDGVPVWSGRGRGRNRT